MTESGAASHEAVVPRPYDLSMDAAAATVMVLAGLLLMPPFASVVFSGAWSRSTLGAAAVLLLWIGAFVAGVAWALALWRGRGAAWRFDRRGMDLWQPGRKTHVIWGEIEHVGVRIGAKGTIWLRLTLVPTGEASSPTTLNIRTLSLRPEALATLDAWLVALVPAAKVGDDYRKWAAARRGLLPDAQQAYRADGAR